MLYRRKSAFTSRFKLKRPRNLRAPPALPRLINPGMASVIDNKERVLGFVLLNELANLHHQFQVRIVGGHGEDLRFEGVVLSEALLEVLELGKHKEVVGTPV